MCDVVSCCVGLCFGELCRAVLRGGDVPCSVHVILDYVGSDCVGLGCIVV